MPVQTCSSNYFDTRFDFGVPLEDVFPPNDLHPRLKYLFAKTYAIYKKTASPIEDILRNHQASIETRLELKQELIFNANYQSNIPDYHLETYFWVLRHFLGLLPLPLLPRYTNGLSFDWTSLGDECGYILQYRHLQRMERHILNQEIALALNMLPSQNILLLDTLIKFIRKICLPNGRKSLNKKSLLFLGRYFSESVAFRPYRPGLYLRNHIYLSLFLYLILSWRVISASLLTSDRFETGDDLSSFAQSCTRYLSGNAQFVPSLTKDIACQTDVSSSDNYCEVFDSDKNIQDRNDSPVEKSSQDIYKLAFIEEKSTKDNEAVEEENTLYQTAFELSLQTDTDTGEKEEWNDIVKGCADTLRKVEEDYIYDDYETFNKEVFNQVGVSKQDTIINKISKHGWTYTPSRLSAFKKQSTPKEPQDNAVSYVKYPDVCDQSDPEECQFASCNTTSCPGPSKARVSEQLFKESPASFVENNSRQKLHNEDRNKKARYVLKRIRFSLEFLRALSPKKRMFKRSKYQRMANGKADTI